jgi:hypothetical protein
MNDYANGATEALSWVLLVIEKSTVTVTAPSKGALVVLGRVIEDVRKDLLRSVAVDFPCRVKA